MNFIEENFHTSRFGLPGFLGGEIFDITLLRLPKLCECCRCFFFESVTFGVCNDN